MLVSFQSRLPGVGGSALSDQHKAGVLKHDFQSRLPGVGGSASARPPAGWPSPRSLSIPFAGSWGLRLWAWSSRSGLGATPFNPVCRELGAPPRGNSSGRTRRRLSIPFAGSWGLRRKARWHARRYDELSIPFAGSWGLRLAPEGLSRERLAFQSRLPGVGGSASGSARDGASRLLSIPFAGSWGLRPRGRRLDGTGSERLSIPFAGSWGLRPLGRSAERWTSPFNPVCRELGAPPPRRPRRPRRPPRPFNPVCRELGAPPVFILPIGDFAHLSIPFAGSWGLRRDTEDKPRKRRLFQSRLPGVGGSAPSGRRGMRRCVSFQSRLPGVGGSAVRRGARDARVPPPFNPVCRELGAPPQRFGRASALRAPFNPVCRELGAPPCRGRPVGDLV